MANFITIADAPKVLAMCARLVKPEGRLIITHFTLHGMSLIERARFVARSFRAFGLPPRGRRDYTLFELETLVQDAGFTMSEAELVGEAVKAVYLRSGKPGVRDVGR